MCALVTGVQTCALPLCGGAMSFLRKLRESLALLPVVLLILAVLGSIYAGIATATEAAVLGVAGSLILSLLQGSLTRESFVGSLMGAVRNSCIIALLLAGADFLLLTMGFTGLPRNLAAWLASLALSPPALITALTGFFSGLG